MTDATQLLFVGTFVVVVVVVVVVNCKGNFRFQILGLHYSSI